MNAHLIRTRLNQMLGWYRANTSWCTVLDRPAGWEARAVALRNRINSRIRKEG